MTFVHSGYTSVRSILSTAVAEVSVACAQDRTAAAAAASATDATISHCFDERKGKKKEKQGYWFCQCQLRSTEMSTCKFFPFFKKRKHKRRSHEVGSDKLQSSSLVQLSVFTRFWPLATCCQRQCQCTLLRQPLSTGAKAKAGVPKVHCCSVHTQHSWHSTTSSPPFSYAWLLCVCSNMPLSGHC